MGGWSDKTKLILISPLVEVVVEVELGNNGYGGNGDNCILCFIGKLGKRGK